MKNRNNNLGGGDLWFLVWVGLGIWFLMAVFFATRLGGSELPSIPSEAFVAPSTSVHV